MHNHIDPSMTEESRLGMAQRKEKTPISEYEMDLS